MEVASGFRFNADSSFDFYFSYGALDRMGRGTWTQQGDSIFLDSPPKPAQDFVLKESKQTADDQVSIKISDPNAVILRYVHCWLKTPEGILEARSDEHGMIIFDKSRVESISLVHELWPDRLSVIEIADSSDNYFVFTIDPRIVEVEFRYVALHIQDEKTLVGEHPLLKGDTYQFVKPE